MKTRFLTSLLCMLAAGCATQAPPTAVAPAKCAAPVVVAPAPAPAAMPAPARMPTSTDQLLAYHRSLRQLLLPDLIKELGNLSLQPATPRLALQKAMVLGLTRGNGDLARAQAYLDSVLHSSEPEAMPLKPLAGLLAAHDAETQHLAEQLEKSVQQTRERERRIDQLNQTLEALKAIERTLPTRPNALVPPAAK